MRLCFTQTHKVGSRCEISDLRAGAILCIGEIRRCRVFHLQGNAQDLSIRSACCGGGGSGQSAGCGGAGGLADAPRDAFRLRRSILPLIAGLQLRSGGITAHAGRFMPGEGVAGAFFYTSLFHPCPFQSSFRGWDWNTDRCRVWRFAAVIRDSERNKIRKCFACPIIFLGDRNLNFIGSCRILAVRCNAQRIISDRQS